MLLKRSHLPLRAFFYSKEGVTTRGKEKALQSLIAGLEFIFRFSSRAGAMNISIRWIRIGGFHYCRYPEDARVDSIQGHV